MAYRYSLLGLSLDCSQPLPHLAALPGSAGESLRVELGSFPSDVLRSPAGDWRPFFKSRYIDHRGEPWLKVCRRSADDLYRFLFREGAHFLVDGEGRRLWIRWRKPKNLEDISIHLLGIILSFVLRLRGMVSLHASAVVIDGQAVALAGTAGAGKSTTAAVFAQRGHPVLTDDITALKPVADGFFVQPDRPEIRLWPESSAMLFGSADALPRLSPDWDKRSLNLELHGFRAERQPRPLAAVYLLDGEPLRAPAIRKLQGPDGFLALQANSLVTLLLDRRMRTQEFDVLTRLSEQLPVRRLHKGELGGTPDEIYEQITDDFRRR